MLMTTEFIVQIPVHNFNANARTGELLERAQEAYSDLLNEHHAIPVVPLSFKGFRDGQLRDQEGTIVYDTAKWHGKLATYTGAAAVVPDVEVQTRTEYQASLWTKGESK